MALGTKTKLGVGGIAALALAQLVPVSRENPPVEEALATPPELQAVLERACYDCHSNQTRWPWYSSVAPISWLVARDVEHAREHLNFSTWNAYSAKERRENLEEALEEVEEGNMPLPPYLWMHADAALSDADVALLRDFVTASGGDSKRDDEHGSHEHGSHEH
jgi:hypothetical protein